MYPGAEKMEGADPAFAAALAQMIADSGGRLGVTSGVRSHEKQKQLWAQALAKYGDPEVADNWVARPGTSNHEHGWAADLSFLTPDAIEWAHQHAAEYGLMFPLSNENWHVEWAGDRMGGGGSGGQGWRSGIMYDLNYMDPTAAQNPKDVLANRLHSVLSILGLDAASAGPGVTVSPIEDPSMDMLASPEAIAATDIGMPIPETGARMEPGQRFGGVTEGPGGAFAGTGSLTPGGPADPHGYGAYAKSLLAQYGWSEADYLAWVALGNEESGTGHSDTHIVAWDPLADNPSSTAFGIGQFLDSTWAGVGGTKTSDPMKQIEYMAKYIANRYGNPRNALDFHHRNNWY